MCYINGVKVTLEEFIEFKQRQKLLKAIDKELQNGFDYSDFPIVKPNLKENDWDIELAHWEFIPSWIQNRNQLLESRKKFTTLNATCEKLLESKMFRDSALKRRCLVLSSGFYEWRHFQPEGAKKPQTYPYHITVASEKPEPLFFMAGIYQTWTDKETGETMDTFAIVTTQANELMQQVHNVKKRMPTILPKHLAEEWISDGLSENRIKEIASYQYPSNEMKAYTIQKKFRTSENPTEKYIYQELPEIIL